MAEYQTFPTAETLAVGRSRILSERRTGSRSIAFIRNDDNGDVFIAFCFYEGAIVRRVGHCFGLRRGPEGFADISAILEHARAVA